VGVFSEHSVDSWTWWRFTHADSRCLDRHQHTQDYELIVEKNKRLTRISDCRGNEMSASSMVTAAAASQLRPVDLRPVLWSLLAASRLHLPSQVRSTH